MTMCVWLDGLSKTILPKRRIMLIDSPSVALVIDTAPSTP